MWRQYRVNGRSCSYVAPSCASKDRSRAVLRTCCDIIAPHRDDLWESRSILRAECRIMERSRARGRQSYDGSAGDEPSEGYVAAMVPYVEPLQAQVAAFFPDDARLRGCSGWQAGQDADGPRSEDQGKQRFHSSPGYCINSG